MAKKPTPHYILVAPSADGTCCPCAAVEDPCTCAGLIPIIRCRQRSALAEMVGFRAYTDPTDPPSTYLIGELGGSSDGYRCDPIEWVTKWTNSGRDTWDPVSGVLSHGCIVSISGEGAGVFPTAFPTSPPASSCGFTVALTPTTYTSTGTGVCCPTGMHQGAFTCRMSQPYTEQQALYRATNGLKWSDWALLTELPGCSALWELRSGTTDYDFAVRESEYQLEFPALTVTEQVQEVDIFGRLVWITPPSVDPATGVHYQGVPSLITTTRQLTAQVEVRVDINRRPWNGGSPWMLYRTDTFGPLPITGTQTLEGVVPNDRGYETIITNVRYRIVG